MCLQIQVSGWRTTETLIVTRTGAAGAAAANMRGRSFPDCGPTLPILPLRRRRYREVIFIRRQNITVGAAFPCPPHAFCPLCFVFISAKLLVRLRRSRAFIHPYGHA